MMRERFRVISASGPMEDREVFQGAQSGLSTHPCDMEHGGPYAYVQATRITYPQPEKTWGWGWIVNLRERT